MANKNNEKQPSTASALKTFASERGLDISNVFDDFLTYIIWAHTLPEYGKPIEGWPYKPEDGKKMYEIYVGLVNELNERLHTHEWYDIFGEIYESAIASKHRRGDNGQFFTPASLCDLMAQISVSKDQEVVGDRISDPSCGSGRNLLAFHSLHPGNYHVGEDIDRTCALMSVCNFLLHGVNGEIIWHNSLNPDTFRGGWRINEYLNNPTSQYFGIPHVRPISIEEYMKPKE